MIDLDATQELYNAWNTNPNTHLLCLFKLLDTFPAMLTELKAAREVVLQSRIMRIYCLGSDASTENMLVRYDAANRNYIEATK